MIVMKFGGTSVGTAESIRAVCRLIQDRLSHKPVVVCSAHNSPRYRMTDTLISSAQKALAGEPDVSDVARLQRGVCKDLGLDTALVDPLLQEYERLLHGVAMIGELSPRTMDVVMSFGERMSCPLIAEILRREMGVNAGYVPSFELGLMTDGVFGSASPDKTCYSDVRKRIHSLDCDALITTGFLGKSPDGHITTLGRGGSDYSATIFGAIVEAEEVQIWTDVDGVMSADPGIVKAARSIPELSFMEASELAWYGAKVLHPATMIPAIDHDIPVRVMNTHKPDHPGSLILPRQCPLSGGLPKSVVYKEHINLVTLTSSRMLGTHGFMAKVFEVFSKHKIDIHMIATSEISISLTIPKDDNIKSAANDLEAIARVEVEHDKAIICVVGENMAGVPGVARRVTGSLADADVNIRMISQGAHELNIALLVDDSDIAATVTALHREFFE